MRKTVKHDSVMNGGSSIEIGTLGAKDCKYNDPNWICKHNKL